MHRNYPILIPVFASLGTDFKKITSKVILSHSAFSLALPFMPYNHCPVLSESIKVSLVSIRSSLIAQKHLFLFSAISGQP